MSEVTDLSITPSDITKPKRAIGKLIGLAEVGIGGVLQEVATQLINGFIPSNIPPEIEKILEVMLFGVAGGALGKKSKHIKNIAAGGIAGASKDFTKQLLSRANIDLAKLIGGTAAAGKPTAAANATSNSAVMQDAENLSLAMDEWS